MTRTLISPSDLFQRTREILDRVQEGELAVVASGGEERIVLLAVLDYRLLRALALCSTGEDANGDLLEARVLRDYLGKKINLGKAAELLQLSRFELEGSFQRLGIPLRRGRTGRNRYRTPACLNGSNSPHIVFRRHAGPEQLCSGPADQPPEVGLLPIS